jgi:lycopene cyclase domain-containing protein
MKHLTYLLLLLGCLALTAPLWFIAGTRVYARPVRLLCAVIPGFVIFMAWDIYAIHAREWTYDSTAMTGVVLPGRVPMEETLFFLVIPVCAVLTYESVRRLRPSSRANRSVNIADSDRRSRAGLR